MINTLLWIASFLLLICWAAGAYNRLMRLRAAVQKSLKSWQDKVEKDQISDNLHIKDLQNKVKVQMFHDEYLAAVSQYNLAIKQVPASVIAVVFNFKSVDTSNDICK